METLKCGDIERREAASSDEREEKSFEEEASQASSTQVSGTKILADGFLPPSSFSSSASPSSPYVASVLAARRSSLLSSATDHEEPVSPFRNTTPSVSRPPCAHPLPSPSSPFSPSCPSPLLPPSSVLSPSSPPSPFSPPSSPSRPVASPLRPTGFCLSRLRAGFLWGREKIGNIWILYLSPRPDGLVLVVGPHWPFAVIMFGLKAAICCAFLFVVGENINSSRALFAGGVLLCALSFLFFVTTVLKDPGIPRMREPATEVGRDRGWSKRQTHARARRDLELGRVGEGNRRREAREELAMSLEAKTTKLSTPDLPASLLLPALPPSSSSSSSSAGVQSADTAADADAKSNPPVFHPQASLSSSSSPLSAHARGGLLSSPLRGVCTPRAESLAGEREAEVGHREPCPRLFATEPLTRACPHRERSAVSTDSSSNWEETGEREEEADLEEEEYDDFAWSVAGPRYARLSAKTARWPRQQRQRRRRPTRFRLLQRRGRYPSVAQSEDASSSSPASEWKSRSLSSSAVSSEEERTNRATRASRRFSRRQPSPEGGASPEVYGHRSAAVRHGVSRLPGLFCRECRIFPPAGSVHCDDCRVCIEGYDHHCPWTSKCVGKGNSREFHAWIILSLVTIFYYGLAAAFLGKEDRPSAVEERNGVFRSRHPDGE
ncbi:UNVERIFIED_CONTAM: DHHC zinc finger domain-containing protein [Hammondia hammondi]|eukprot:XP_008889510.1 DHHC zinc finger domain-containing protein [Hammondia hammondi]